MRAEKNLGFVSQLLFTGRQVYVSPHTGTSGEKKNEKTECTLKTEIIENTWQQVNHPTLYSDLLKASITKETHFVNCGLSRSTGDQ